VFYQTHKVNCALRGDIWTNWNMTDLTKPEARTQAFAARKLAHKSDLDIAACAHLADFLSQLGGGPVIAAYMPIRTEISPISVMTTLVAANVAVGVPVIQGEGQPLKFSRWTPDTTMVKGPFGAAIPQNHDFVIPDIMITPLVAYDARGYRLGYGGGFYDRTFELLRRDKPALAVGFAYSSQELPHVPTEPTDIRLDAIITENGTIQF
jgi:5-formyltetrahydrofolate cyclo-ligase